MKLTVKQKRFAEYYLETGNATQSAIKAGYSEKTARSIGQENLTKPAISLYISQRLSEQDEKLVAKVDEVLKFYTAAMRGEIKDQFGIEASLSDRLKAADSLMKRFEKAVTVDDNNEPDALSKSLEEMGKELTGD